MSSLSILYRGPLSSCNYDCNYCPFAKRHQTASELADDRRKLERFTDWVSRRSAKTAVFFTPWGEALSRRWYQTAFCRLSHLEHVTKVAAQTNLSCSLQWLDACDQSKVALWCTYHPSQVARATFLSQCRQLTDRGVAHSVGMVGLPGDFAEIEAMRAELPAKTYLWINAWDIGEGRKYNYSAEEIARLETIDPHFRTNTTDHPSLGRVCQSGTRVIAVDGDGQISRCHFVPKPLGNVYDPDFERRLSDTPCPNATCGCHIGYVHLSELKQQSIYGDQILERIPKDWSVSESRKRPFTVLP